MVGAGDDRAAEDLVTHSGPAPEDAVAGMARDEQRYVAKRPTATGEAPTLD